LLRQVFPTVIDNPKMLRNFVQIIRSGAVGRKSLGSAPKKLVEQWFASRNHDQIFRGSIGNDPSMADVIKMAHPKPQDATRNALYGYLIGKKHDAECLPTLVKHFEAFKKDPEHVEMPAVDFRMVTALPLSKEAWKAIAGNMSWQTLRMNLNTLERHGVLSDKKMVRMVAEKLRDPNEVRRSRVFPYQLMVAFMNYDGEPAIKEALQDAMDIAVENVPTIEGNVVVAIDVSGSMNDPITGKRVGATSKVRCVEVAGLFAACLIKKNPTVRVMPFHGEVRNVTLNPRDSIMTNAEKLARLCTNCTRVAAPLERLNADKAKVDAVIYFSDNESWMERWSASRYCGFGQIAITDTMNEWNKLRKRNPKCKLACVDLTPNQTSQAKESADVLNIGGFSDVIFDILNEFFAGDFGKDFWTRSIEKIDLNTLDKLRA
jgi:60 kDa SS-A/Ro ribonucleoprotein